MDSFGFNKLTANIDAETKCAILEAMNYLRFNALNSSQIKLYLDTFEINHNRSARITLEKCYEAYALSILNNHE